MGPLIRYDNGTVEATSRHTCPSLHEGRLAYEKIGSIRLVRTVK